jgi:hypothetical protein
MFEARWLKFEEDVNGEVEARDEASRSYNSPEYSVDEADARI